MINKDIVFFRLLLNESCTIENNASQYFLYCSSQNAATAGYLCEKAFFIIIIYSIY